MGFLRGYLKPREKAVELQQQNETQDSPPSVGGSSSTGLKALTPMYPMGDFRNADMDEVSEIKSDVMVNYLHQQQLRKMWSHGGLEEGVLLKKSRNDYMCCPQDLSQVRGGIFDCVVKMNVRVCLFSIEKVRILSPVVCTDSQHENHQAVPSTTGYESHSIRQWLTHPDSPQYSALTSVPEASLCCVHSRFSYTCCMG